MTRTAGRSRTTPTAVSASAAVEEVLRYESPSGLTSLRYTTEPVTIAGTAVPEGEFVQIALPAANRDPAAFADPGRHARAGSLTVRVEYAPDQPVLEVADDGRAVPGPYGSGIVGMRERARALVGVRRSWAFPVEAVGRVGVRDVVPASVGASAGRSARRRRRHTRTSLRDSALANSL